MAERDDPRDGDDSPAADDRAAADESAGQDRAVDGDGQPGSGESADSAAGESPEARREQLEERVAAFRDQALRAQAELENVRRRAARDVENAHKFALEKFSADLLPVLDSLEKAVEVAADSDADAIAEGVKLSLKLFMSVLEKYGIESIDPTGEPFDPQVHEAMAMVPSPSAEPNSVLEVMQRGYLLNGRVVRAAKVVVARAP